MEEQLTSPIKGYSTDFDMMNRVNNYDETYIASSTMSKHRHSLYADLSAITHQKREP